MAARMKMVKTPIRVICPYCGRRATLIVGETLPEEDVGPDSFFRKEGVKVWRCPGCAAMTIADKYSMKPLGELADLELRRARWELHRLFDKLWRSKKIYRTQAYAVLAVKIGVKKRDCHFSTLNKKQCELAKKKIIEMLKYWEIS